MCFRIYFINVLYFYGSIQVWACSIRGQSFHLSTGFSSSMTFRDCSFLLATIISLNVINNSWRPDLAYDLGNNLWPYLDAQSTKLSKISIIEVIKYIQVYKAISNPYSGHIILVLSLKNNLEKKQSKYYTSSSAPSTMICEGEFTLFFQKGESHWVICKQVSLSYTRYRQETSVTCIST